VGTNVTFHGHTMVLQPTMLPQSVFDNTVQVIQSPNVFRFFRAYDSAHSKANRWRL